MNNLEIEFIFLARKVWGNDWDEEDIYKSPEDAIERNGGIISFEDNDGDLLYNTSGSLLGISYARHLRDTLVEDGDIEPVVCANPGVIDFSADIEDDKIERVRVDKYLAKLRAKIAVGEITV